MSQSLEHPPPPPPPTIINRKYSIREITYCKFYIAEVLFRDTGLQYQCTLRCNGVILLNVGHFGHGHFGLGRFGPDISATDISATENAKGGRFGQIINFGLGCVHT